MLTILNMMIQTPSRHIRALAAADGPALHQLIAACPPLDCNSRYAYLLLCRDFAQTSAVAEEAGELVGAITAYIPPQRSDTLFVWQVAVHPSRRGRGLARAMLRHILGRPALHRVAWVEATVGPGNAASQRLFAGLAAAPGASLATAPLFGREHLGDGHEPEILHRVGPLAAARLAQAV